MRSFDIKEECNTLNPETPERIVPATPQHLHQGIIQFKVKNKKNKTISHSLIMSSFGSLLIGLERDVGGC